MKFVYNEEYMEGRWVLMKLCLYIVYKAYSPKHSNKLFHLSDLEGKVFWNGKFNVTKSWFQRNESSQTSKSLLFEYPSSQSVPLKSWVYHFRNWKVKIDEKHYWWKKLIDKESWLTNLGFEERETDCILQSINRERQMDGQC